MKLSYQRVDEGHVGYKLRVVGHTLDAKRQSGITLPHCAKMFI